MTDETRPHAPTGGKEVPALTDETRSRTATWWYDEAMGARGLGMCLGGLVWLSGCLEHHDAPSSCDLSAECPANMRCVDQRCVPGTDAGGGLDGGGQLDARPGHDAAADGAPPPADAFDGPVADAADGALDAAPDAPSDAGSDAERDATLDAADDAAADATSDGAVMPGDVVRRFDEPGVHAITVAAGVVEIEVEAHGAGGGGIGAQPWGTAAGGRGGRVIAGVPVSPGATYRVIVGGGGRAAGCGGVTPGSGGGGHSSFIDGAGTPLASAGGGGGGQYRHDGCDAASACPEECASVEGAAGGSGFGGGGQRSDATVGHGQPGAGAPSFTAGAVGAGNCGDTQGSGGVGGGGGGGGTFSGFGGGGGGGGFPGGCGGVPGGSGHGGQNAIGPGVAVRTNDALGALGGGASMDGANGYVVLRFTVP